MRFLWIVALPERAGSKGSWISEKRHGKAGGGMLGRRENDDAGFWRFWGSLGVAGVSCCCWWGKCVDTQEMVRFRWEKD